MARTNQKRRARTSAASYTSNNVFDGTRPVMVRNKIGNSGNGNACKLNSTAAAQYGQFCSLLAATGNYTIPQLLDQQSMWLLSHMTTAATATVASKDIAPARRQPRQAAAPSAARQPRKARTPRAGTAGMDLNKAILSVMPDTRPIQQGNLVQAIQAKYPNRWKGNIIGAGLGRFQKAGTLVRQGGTGNKAVWALAPSAAQPELRTGTNG